MKLKHYNNYNLHNLSILYRSFTQCFYSKSYCLLTRDLHGRLRSRSYHKMNLQMQFYAYVTYWPKNGKILVETCSHVIYINKNQ